MPEPTNPTPAAPSAAEIAADYRARAQAEAKARAEIESANAAEKAKADADEKAKAKVARKAARKELKGMFAMDRKAPGFDHKRFHALHYLAAGKPVPEADED
jgi:membrane protein involved in colicin uptake